MSIELFENLKVKSNVDDCDNGVIKFVSPRKKVKIQLRSKIPQEKILMKKKDPKMPTDT